MEGLTLIIGISFKGRDISCAVYWACGNGSQVPNVCSVTQNPESSTFLDMLPKLSCDSC
jgi:hypothetical protein